MSDIARTLIFIGAIFILLGVAMMLLKIFPIGHLPGDIVIRKKNLTIWMPITSMIVLSLVLTLIFNLFFRK